MSRYATEVAYYRILGLRRCGQVEVVAAGVATRKALSTLAIESKTFA